VVNFKTAASGALDDPGSRDIEDIVKALEQIGEMIIEPKITSWINRDEAERKEITLIKPKYNINRSSNKTSFHYDLSSHFDRNEVRWARPNAWKPIPP